MSQSCFGCETFTFWDGFLESFAGSVHAVVHEPVQTVVMASAGIVFVAMGAQTMLRGQVNVPKVVGDTMFWLTGVVLLGDITVLSLFLDAGTDFFFGMVGRILGGGGGGITIVDAIASVDSLLVGSINAAATHAKEGVGSVPGFNYVIGGMAGILQLLPILVLELIFVAAVAEFIVKRFIVKAFGPVFFGALAFKATRPFASNTLRMLAQAGLNVLFVSAIAEGVGAMAPLLGDVAPYDENGVYRDVDDYVFSGGYWAYFGITTMSAIIAFKCATWSGQIVQFFESAGTAMALTALAGKVAGGAMGAGAALGKGVAALGRQTGALHQAGQAVGGAVRRHDSAWMRPQYAPMTPQLPPPPGGGGFAALPPPPPSLPPRPGPGRAHGGAYTMGQEASGSIIYAPANSGLLSGPRPVPETHRLPAPNAHGTTIYAGPDGSARVGQAERAGRVVTPAGRGHLIREG